MYHYDLDERHLIDEIVFMPLKIKGYLRYIELQFIAPTMSLKLHLLIYLYVFSFSLK